MTTVTLVGFGLLASSLAAAWRQTRPALRIQAVSSPDSCRIALETKLADQTFSYSELPSALETTDILILCAPISHIANTLKSLPNLALSRQEKILVSDIGSTKYQASQIGLTLKEPYLFVGGHPMAGSEKRGAAHADPALFENAYWILCPGEIDKKNYQPLIDLIEAVGAHPVIMDAAEHDMVMARLSHVPQMVSTALASGLSPQILAKGQQHLAGRGFRDMTRIAASPWPMWRDIVDTNRYHIQQGIQEFRNSLEQLENALASDEKDSALEGVFRQGGMVRASLSQPGKGFANSLHEVLVELVDRPGALLTVLQPLTEANLNLLDMELAKVREGIGGTLLLGFKTLVEADQCVHILQNLGYQARSRG